MFPEGDLRVHTHISIHALREEGDGQRRGADPQREISIHALREEGDGCSTRTVNSSCIFLSTPSARRATGREFKKRAYPRNFYPRPPRGGRLVSISIASRCRRISIHALREEGDGQRRGADPQREISIHALREEGDKAIRSQFLLKSYFYPRPPRGGRLVFPEGDLRVHTHISIHALREEGDM